MARRPISISGTTNGSSTRPLTGVERRDGLDLRVGHRQGAARRLPRQDRAGDPAHHQRNQGVDSPRRGEERRRRVHRRGRRNGRRHRDPARSSSDSAGPQRTSEAKASVCPRPPWCPIMGANGELKTKPTQHSVRELQGSRGIPPDAIVGRTARPSRGTEARRSACFATCRRKRSSKRSYTSTTSTRSRSTCTSEGLDDDIYATSAFDCRTHARPAKAWEAMVDRDPAPDQERVEWGWSAGLSTVRDAIPLDRTRPCVKAATTTTPGRGPTGSRPETVEDGGPEGRRGTRRHRHPRRASGARHRGKDRARSAARIQQIPFLGICFGLHEMT